ncbi:MAG TPA: HEAT repeat domain-containing protein [Actinomycetota bacterium]|nr:HEAT repeat domain-containing protein [Actinomycetota bacterium]
MKDDEADRGPSASKALQALRVAIGVVRLYPDPTGQPGMQRALASFQELQFPIRFEVTARGFRIAADLIPQEAQVEKIAKALFDRGVEELHIRSAPEARELIALTKLVSSEPDEIEALGGAMALLASEGVVAFRLVERKLEVTADFEQGSPDEEQVPQLMQGHKELAEALESLNDPAAALAHLETLFEEGQRAGVDAVTLQGGIADAIAELTEQTRAALMGSIMQQIDASLPKAIIGQLSDGEISDALLILADVVAPDSVMGFASQIVAESRGRRGELPVILARKLLAAGVTTHKIAEAAQGIAGGGPLSIEDAEDDIDLAELRGEGLEFASDVFEGGILTIRALFIVEEEDQDFERLVEHAEDSIQKWVSEFPERCLALLELLTEMSTSHPDPVRRVRFDQALKRSASPELVEHFLGKDSRLGDSTSQRFISAMGPRAIPLLLAQLGGEEDQGRRKAIVEFIAVLASTDISLVLAGLSDPKWFLVRNIATILGRTKRPDAVPHLSGLLKHGDARVRREAIRALGSLGDTAVASLVRSLDDPQASVRLAGLGALGGIDSRTSSEHLSRFIADRKRNLTERKHALDSLRLHTSIEAEAALEQASRHKWPPLPANLQLARHARDILARKAPK